MEQSEHFKSANQVSKEFEQQIKKCDDALLLLEKVCYNLFFIIPSPLAHPSLPSFMASHCSISFFLRFVRK